MAGASLITAVMVLMLALAPCVTATSYFVAGAADGWSVGYKGNPFYLQSWADEIGPVHTTDSLVFGFTANEAVLLVSLADYEACRTTLPIREYDDPTPGAALTTAVFNLANYGISTLYFIGKASRCLCFGPEVPHRRPQFACSSAMAVELILLEACREIRDSLESGRRR